MSRLVMAGMLAAAAVGAHAEGDIALGLSPADLERLGVVLQAPALVDEVEIAAGPAQIVIPPAQEAIVSSTLGGSIARLLVAEGDAVAAGQALAELMSAELLTLEREYVEAALARDLARAQLERDRGLNADGIVAERRVQESRAAERAATTMLTQVRQQLVLAGLDDYAIDRLVETGELDPHLTLTAPFPAVVVEQLAGLGARVDTLDPVYRVADLARLWVEVRVPQERADRIEPGMRVVTTVAGRALDAEVIQVGRVVDAASQAVVVRASVANDDLALRPGQFLTARVLAARRGRGAMLAVPTSAVVRLDGSAFVFGRRNGDVAALNVEIYAEDGVNTYVHGGLEPGAEIAVAGIAALKSVWMSAQGEGE